MPAEFIDPPRNPTASSGLTVAAFICGILGLLCLLPAAIVGLILSIMAFNRGPRTGLTTAALVLNIVGLALVPFMAIIAAIAIPNLLESRVTANESAAAACLKSAIFAGQAQFQSGNYNDQDRDNMGEYGFLPQLAGSQPPFGSFSGPALTLIGREFGQPEEDPVVCGYHFRIYLPTSDQEMAAYGDYCRLVETKSLPQAGIDQAEKYFVAYAWPETWGDTGRRAFAITQDGKLFVLPAQGNPPWPQAPSWFALWGQPGPIKTLLRSEPQAPWTRLQR